MIVIAERIESRVTPTSSFVSCKKCPLCKHAKHKLYECYRFQSYGIEDRISFVNSSNMCENCLSTNLHYTDDCPSKVTCKICSQTHHSLLHQFSETDSVEEDKCLSKCQPSCIHSNSHHVNQSKKRSWRKSTYESDHWDRAKRPKKVCIVGWNQQNEQLGKTNSKHNPADKCNYPHVSRWKDKSKKMFPMAMCPKSVLASRAEMFMKCADSMDDELYRVQDKILELCEEDAVEEQESHYHDISFQLMDIQVILNKYLKSQNNSRISSVQLPTITLPTFNGSVENWSSFRDLFFHIIHNNNELSSVQKFQYLKTSLTEDAACLVQHLPLTTDNYNIAWDLLNENYSNKNLAVYYHLKNIFNVTYSSSNRLIALKTMLNVLRSNLSAIKSLDVNTMHWDVLIIHLMESKFDDELFAEWIRRQNKKSLPTLPELYEFLSEMIVIAERIESRVTPTSSFVSCKKCPLCKHAKHKLYECYRFQSYGIEDRISFVNSSNMCENCLSTNLHYTDDCPSKVTCKICSQTHHSLLHQFSETDAVEEDKCVSKCQPSCIHSNSHHANQSKRRSWRKSTYESDHWDRAKRPKKVCIVGWNQQNEQLGKTNSKHNPADKCNYPHVSRWKDKSKKMFPMAMCPKSVLASRGPDPDD
ncbi:hypothetical protein WDU94_005462 [Cyamophila willieti]